MAEVKYTKAVPQPDVQDKLTHQLPAAPRGGGLLGRRIYRKINKHMGFTLLSSSISHCLEDTLQTHAWLIYI